MTTCRQNLTLHKYVINFALNIIILLTPLCPKIKECFIKTIIRASKQIDIPFFHILRKSFADLKCFMLSNRAFDLSIAEYLLKIPIELLSPIKINH